MSLVPVPRFLPRRNKEWRGPVDTTPFLDGLPKGWRGNQLTGEDIRNGRIDLTNEEKAATDLSITGEYGPSSFGPPDTNGNQRSGVGIWRHVPRADWQALNLSKLHRVVALHSRLEKARGSRFVYDGWWRHPEWWETSLDSGTHTQVRRVDWNTTVVETIVDGPRQTLAELFREKGIPYTYEKLPMLSSAQLNQLKYEQVQAGWDAGTCTVEITPASVAIGYPKTNDSSCFTLVAGPAAAMAAPGETVFECDRLDLYEVYVLVRIVQNKR
jgi:hypothetical protein